MSIAGRRILIIDDVADVRMRVRKMLESFGLIALEANSVVEGLSVASKEDLALVILDLQMAGKSGFDFLTARKTSLALKGVPVIVMSGLSDKTSVQKAIALGATDYVIKPPNATVLLQRIRKHLMGDQFREYSFAETERPVVRVTSDARVTRLDCTSFTLEAPVQIAQGTSLEFPPPLLESLSLECAFFISCSEPGPLTIQRNYQTEVEAIGLTNPINQKK